MIQKILLFLVPGFFQIGKRRRDVISTDQVASDKETFKALFNEVLVWCVTNNFVIPRENGSDVFIPNIVDVTMDSKLRSHIYMMNLKQLRNNNYLSELLHIMRDTQHDKTTSRLLDLHIQLVTELDPRFLNLYLNKLIYALNSVYPNTDADNTWEEIFKEYPYLWLLFPIQRVMRRPVIL